MNRIFSGFIALMSVLASNQEVRSQDYYNFAQFFVNPSLINPSMTGIDGQPAVFLGYKKQWLGINGAPSVGHFSLQVPSPSKIGIGLNAGNDTRGVLSSTTLGLSLSYYATMANEMYLRFGFSIGAGWTKVDVNSLVFGTTSDAVMADLLNSNFQLLGNAGLSFHSKTFQIGAAIPNIFQPTYLSKDAFTVSQVKPFESLIFHSSYRFYFSRDQHAFEPYVIYRLNSSLPSQIEAAGVVHLKNIVWFGGSYKQNFGISGLLGFKLTKLAAFGYSYTLKNTGINELAKPSHEIQLALLFGTHEKKTPIYSFVNAEREKRRMTTQERLAALAKTRPKNPPPTKGKTPTTKTNPQTNPNISRPRNQTTTLPTLTPTTNNQTTTTNPTTTNPTTTNPTTTNPTTTNPTTTNPTTTNQTTTNPTTTNPTTTNPTTTNPTTTNPTTTNPTTTNPTTTNPTTTNQTTTNPTTTNPTTTNPTTTNPTTTNPTTTNPNTTNPTTTNPTTPNPTTTQTTEGAVIERPERFTSAADSIQHQEEVEKLSRLTEHAGDPDAEHNETTHAERHEFATRGNHAEELELGDYVIVGAFRSEVNAKHMTDELKKLGFSEADYGYLTSKSVWYIHFAPSDDIEEAKAKRNKYRKMKMFKDAWLLTVHQ